MRILEGYFWKGVLPLLWIGGAGTGIKLSIKDGELLDSDWLVFSDDSNTVASVPLITQPSTIPTVGESYESKLKREGLALVNSSTEENVLKNILKQRMFPHYSWTVNYEANKLFQGSSPVKLTNHKYETKQKQSLYVLDEPTKDDADKLRADCIKELVNTSWNSSQHQKLKEWCTIPTIQAVLKRHKFRLLDTTDKSTRDNNYWKNIISGGWFRDTYKNQQTFINGNDLGKLSKIKDKDSVTTEHIGILKTKCRSTVSEAFVKKSFPATKDFIDNLDSQDKPKFLTGVDLFQQVALFCTEPITAEKYIQDAMNGQGASTIAEKHKKDYCYSSAKTNIATYKSTKTYEPFEGKSFWCAVRIAYESKNAKKTR